MDKKAALSFLTLPGKRKDEGQMDEDYYFADRPGDKAAADFCVVLDTDDMEPFIHAGERVYVSIREPLEELDAGLFLLDGRIICRQWCEDYRGALYLLCANPLREKNNVCLSRERRGECLCLGKVLLPKALPRPVYEVKGQL